MEKFRIALGDLSQDGHNIYKEYMLMTDQTLYKVWDTYDKVKAKGIDFEKLCSAYGDYKIERSWFTQHNIAIEDLKLIIHACLQIYINGRMQDQSLGFAVNSQLSQCFQPSN